MYMQIKNFKDLVNPKTYSTLPLGNPHNHGRGPLKQILTPKPKDTYTIEPFYLFFNLHNFC